MRRLMLSAAALLAVAPAELLQAQTFSDEQLLQMFNAQRQVFRDASTGGGQTRGLSLITLDDAQVQAGTSVDALAPPPTAGTVVAAPGTGGDVSVLGGTTALAAPGQDALPTIGGSPQPLAPDPVVTAAAAPAQPEVYGVLPQDMQVNLNIRFGFDSAAIADDQLPVLTQMCTVMKASDINLFRIVGHTDASGSDDYNEQLSGLRAQEVARWLVNDCGIAASRIETLGLGERVLKNPSNPRADENRRVEFQALS
ncbi:MAG: OmpA family protein [Rhodobacteraceae bacterium]|jgi:outer membrane protein OmpA-like peptidoglycan-associated protein|nr:OmpA family protein [Paracoccaceae bacterium]